MEPTAEQQAALDAFGTGQDLALEAGAGSGKTSTLRLQADSTRRGGIYIAYNRAIAQEAKARFPRSVQCATAHALAMRDVGRRFAHRLSAPRMPAKVAARILGIREPLDLGVEGLAPLAPQQQVRISLRTVERFCWSADEQPAAHHVPKVPGLDDPQVRTELAHAITPWAQRAWADLSRPDGQLRYSHDCYLKSWSLQGPRLDADYLLCDEWQDANPVLASVIDEQTHTQRVAVGDPSQAIYGWRGAVDSLSTFPATHRLPLSKSFRFGSAIAREANKWLQVLHARLRITGHDPIQSRLAPLPTGADAVLCRSNAEAVAELLAAHTDAVPAAIVGGGRDIRALAEAAISLHDGRGTAHPELCAFQTWGQVQDFVEHDHGGADLKTFVNLIDAYDSDVVIDAVDRSVAENKARRVISTAHKAKGREWARVRIADDFAAPRGDADDIARPEAMLAYVAVTRAREVLDRGSLAYIDEWAQQPQQDCRTRHHGQ